MNTPGLVFAVGRKCVEQFRTLGTKAALEAYVNGELDEDELIAAVLLRCRHDLQAIKETLSLLDEYHRRGLVDTSVYLSAKTEVNMLTFRSNVASRSTSTNRSNNALDQFSSGKME